MLFPAFRRVCVLLPNFDAECSTNSVYRILSQGAQPKRKQPVRTTASQFMDVIRLKVMQLREMRLSGPLQQMGGIVYRLLYLDRNQLSGSLAAGIGQLRNLR
jgi:hypothetical protein